ncbi:MAG: alpha/beta hydrolase [Rhodobacteraceae bacterium]|nr:alpha/beta hydrolase [Paracoccaceae bacterium]
MTLDLAIAAATAAGLAGAALAWRRFRLRLAAARSRLPPAAVHPTRHGPVAAAAAGAGAPVLVLHGALGGHDQGLALAAPLVPAGFRTIAPSRMGYLGSALPGGAGPFTQAEILVDLLDRLGVDRTVVAGFSAGAIPALAFAAAHPQRTRALVLLLPVLRPPGALPVLPWGRLRWWLAERLMATDAFAWAALGLGRRWLLGAMMATDPALRDRADPAERARVDAFLDAILPLAPRRPGLFHDARAVLEPADPRLLGWAGPTLVVATADDRFGTAGVAGWIAGHLAVADLAVLPDGGHLAVGRQDEIAALVTAFLARHP